MSKNLIEYYPLLVLPTLAVALGLHESIVIQQLHFLLGKLEGKVIEGRKWIYMPDRAWPDQFPFWTRNTVRGLLNKLEKMGFVMTGNYNASTLDHRTWSSIDY